MPGKKVDWKPLMLDENIFSQGVSGIEGLIGIEELSDYNIENFKKKKSEIKKLDEVVTSPTSSVKKRPSSDDESDTKPKKKKKKTKNKNQVSKSRAKGWSVTNLKDEDFVENDMTTWKNLFTPEPVIKALAELGFAEPTQIQLLTLPAAIMGKRDILGAAETGSGKTLAFGIPIIQGILNYRERVKNGHVTDEFNPGEDDGTEDCDPEDEDEEMSDVEEEEGLGCVKVVPMGMTAKSVSKPRRKLHALVLTPTRELAIQVKNHLIAAAKYCDIKIATVVGGMSQEKQERVLRKGPDIVVATPGRLWELIKEGNAHLQQVDIVPFLVIDEADRMLEKGHFQELRDLVERMQLQSEGSKVKRQTLVFSATLTLVHEPPSRLRHKQGKQTKNKKKKAMRVTPGQKLQELISLLNMNKPKVVDVTAKQCTADSLIEAHIPCALEEKDAHLYCFLQRHPGRTLVFCNSVTCVRRLAQLFTLLCCKPNALHAQMAQKQRLRSLDKFAADPKGLLLATDVAARGLDIPNVQHVIHYQVPRTSESYVHRSGRTARAHNEGLTLLLVEPKEIPLYARLCRNLGREQELPRFPVDPAVFSAVQERVQAARHLESLEHTQRRGQAEEGWLSKAAKELDLHFDEHDKLPIKASMTPTMNKSISIQKKALKSMLSQPLVQRGRSSKYPTSSGTLQVPFAAVSAESPISLVREASKPSNKVQGLGASLGLGKRKRRKFRHKNKK